MKLPGVMIVPGLYDDDGTLHFDAVEYLRGQGVPVNAHNVALVEAELKRQFGERWPGVPVHELDAGDDLA